MLKNDLAFYVSNLYHLSDILAVQFHLKEVVFPIALFLSRLLSV